jgi:hypothetical protein
MTAAAQQAPTTKAVRRHAGSSTVQHCAAAQATIRHKLFLPCACHISLCTPNQHPNQHEPQRCRMGSQKPSRKYCMLLCNAACVGRDDLPATIQMAQQQIRPSTTYLTTAMRKVRLQPNMHGFAPASVSRMFCCSPGTASATFPSSACCKARPATHSTGSRCAVVGQGLTL